MEQRCVKIKYIMLYLLHKIVSTFFRNVDDCRTDIFIVPSYSFVHTFGLETRPAKKML